MAAGCSCTNRATYFRGPGERNFVYVRMFDQRLAGCAIAVDDVDHAMRKTNLLANLGESQRGKRRELRRLQNDSVSRSQRRSNLPCEHEQREVPGNDLANHAARGVAGKFRLDELRPSGMMIKVANNQSNINVATLAYRLSVVDRLENCEPA